MRRAATPRSALAGAGAVACAFAAGSVPFSQLAARLAVGADLRQVGNGTVSGTALYDVAGFAPLAAAGVFEVAKGALGPVVAGKGRPWTAAAAAAAAIVAHDWSPWLGGAGGRGLSPALGATAVLAPEGTVLLLAGMTVGRALRRSGSVVLATLAALVPFLWWRRGPAGGALGLAVSLPILLKRLAGNAPPAARGAGGGPALPAAGGRWAPDVLWSRLVFDRDPDGTGRTDDRGGRDHRHPRRRAGSDGGPA